MNRLTGFSSGRDPPDSSHRPDVRLSGAAEEILRHPGDQLNFDLLTFPLWPPLEAALTAVFFLDSLSLSHTTQS